MLVGWYIDIVQDNPEGQWNQRCPVHCLGIRRTPERKNRLLPYRLGGKGRLIINLMWFLRFEDSISLYISPSSVMTTMGISFFLWNIGRLCWSKSLPQCNSTYHHLSIYKIRGQIYENKPAKRNWLNRRANLIVVDSHLTLGIWSLVNQSRLLSDTTIKFPDFLLRGRRPFGRMGCARGVRH